MNKLIWPVVLVLFLTSCFQDPDKLIPNTNPYDKDFPFDLVAFDKVVALPITSNGRCWEEISVKIVEETYLAIDRTNVIPHEALYVSINNGIDYYPSNTGRNIRFLDIELDNSYIFKTRTFDYDCDDTSICVMFSLVQFVEDPFASPISENHTINYLISQELCFERTL